LGKDFLFSFKYKILYVIYIKKNAKRNNVEKKFLFNNWHNVFHLFILARD
ncbi:unnamed protein product, partial [marine sediment metagenome]